MVPDESTHAAVYELPLPQDLPAEARLKGSERPLPKSLLSRNAQWYCRCRWFVIAALAFYGVLGLFPRSTEYFAIRPPGVWPFVTAAVLTLSNLAFLSFARGKTTAARIRLNLWGQIVSDLVVLTVVVYFVGSLETNIAFTYLFHIVLSCVFFSRRQSLIVTIIAIGMFTVCVTAEYVLKVLPPASIFAALPSQPGASPAPMVLPLNFVFAVGIWLTVWYLASGLSSMVRQMDFELLQTNRRLVAAQKERSRHMLATTHQLKAPFAAIYSNAQLLLQGYCGDLPEQAMQVVRRISSRCRRLTAEIQEMLQLANLSSASQQPPAATKMVSTELLLWCMSQVEPIAREHGVVFKANIQPVAMVGTEDHFKMLFVNLLSNAVVYSHRDGQVRVSCLRGPNSEPVVTIADDGIGIAGNKLPHIFEEHYRTKEAVQHNKESSGLGLSIVKQVAEMYGIAIRVESRPGGGTKFELRFPHRALHGMPHKGTHNGAAPGESLDDDEEGEMKWPTF